MQLLINKATIRKLFKTDSPAVSDILHHPLIKGMIGKSKVVSVYKDTMNATNLGNYVVSFIPKIKGAKR